MMEDLLDRAASILSDAKSLFVLTGAGVSAESGVPTFRDAQTGHWSNFDAETLASPRGFAADPGLVWRWYMERLDGMGAANPNPGHDALARLEARLGDRFVLFTQNVDDLHERAGSCRVRHLHGSIARFRCHACGAPHELRAEERRAAEPPRCASCGKAVRPDVVWFGEMLPPGLLEEAAERAAACEVTLVAGTSGVVYPAADLPFLARRAGRPVVDVNPEPTPISRIAAVYLPGRSGEVLPMLVDRLTS
jgi:NAD-dependent deacetylase